MNIVNLLFTIGNVLLFFAAFPMFKTVVENRNDLKGFSLYGAVLTYSGLIMLMGGYLTLSNWGSVLFASPTLVTWGTIVFYTIAHKLILRESKSTSSEVGSTPNKERSALRVPENEVMRHRRHRFDKWE